MAKAILSPVQFHGSTIFVVTHKGEPYAPIKPIVEDMGLDWRSQATKLRNNKAVSYTHLDVYKRQVLATSPSPLKIPAASETLAR